MERFCKDLREHARLNYEKREMILLTDKENKSHEKQKFATYVKNNLILIKMIKMHLNYIIKLEIIDIIQKN